MKSSDRYLCGGVVLSAAFLVACLYMLSAFLPKPAGFREQPIPSRPIPLSQIALSNDKELEEEPPSYEFPLRRISGSGMCSSLYSLSSLPVQIRDGWDKMRENGDEMLRNLLNRGNFFIQVYGGTQRLLLRNYSEDVDPQYNVVKLKNGSLGFSNSEPVTSDPRQQGVEMVGFANRVQDRFHIPVLYVQAPSKSDITELPDGLRDKADGDADLFLSVLDKSDAIDTLDLRPVFREKAEDNPEKSAELFFRTDHHWTPKGAFLGFRTLAETLEENYNVPLREEWLSKDQYDITSFEGAFLGSQGKRVGSLYAGTDDTEIWAPKFPTDFSYDVPLSYIHREGSFSSSLLFPELLAKKGLYDTNPYVVWSGGDFINASAMNNKAEPDAPRIMILRDSFGCGITPFLSLIGSETVAMDLRTFNGNQKDVLHLISWKKPDILIILNTSSSLQIDKLFPYLPSCRARSVLEKEAEKAEVREEVRRKNTGGK